MNNILLSLNGVSKKYGRKTVLDNINLQINKGDVYGLIGQNGSGKTTIMKIITNLTDQTSGSISIMGEDRNNITKYQRIGAVIESPAIYSNLSAYKNMKVACIQKGIKDNYSIDEALHLVSLTDTGNKKAGKFSLGMKQRLGVALAILGSPDLLILDEPINGLDPFAIIEFREIINKINKEKNTTILISSHILSELYQVSNRFGFLHKGMIIEDISKEDWDKKCKSNILIKTSETDKAAVCLNDNGIKNYRVLSNNTIEIDGKHDESDLIQLLVKNRVKVEQFLRNEDNLETYYTNLINGRRE